MNNLSWFIYFVQLADGASVLCIWCCAFCVAGFVGRGLITAIRGESAWINTSCMGGADVQARKKVWESFNPKTGAFLSGFLFFATLAVVIPSRQTLLMVAASEAGERIAKSESVSSIVNPGMDLIRKWIKQEADKIKEKS